jgi:hypothetical protein
LLGRLGAAFVAPEVAASGRVEAPALPVVAAPRTIAVLTRPEDARAVGGAVALAVAGGARPAVVAVWAAEKPSQTLRAPATPAARRLSAALARRGHDAHPTGRLVVVALGGSSTEACAEAARIAAAAGDAPVVSVLAGPRDDRTDVLLRAQDRVVLSAGAGATVLADLVLASLAAADIPARPLAAEIAPAGRALAATGTALGGALRKALEAALR